MVSFYRPFSSRSSWRRSRRDSRQPSPSMSTAFWCSVTSLRAWRVERYPPEEISSMKPLRSSLDASASSRQLPRLWLLERKGAVQEINFAASCRFGPFQSWETEKSAPAGRNQQTLSVKGWLRQIASCGAFHQGAGSVGSDEWTMADGDAEGKVR